MLQQHELVVLVTVDFSKASDSVKHLSLMHYRPETENASQYILLEEALYKCSITFELHFLALSSSR